MLIEKDRQKRKNYSFQPWAFIVIALCLGLCPRASAGDAPRPLPESQTAPARQNSPDNLVEIPELLFQANQSYLDGEYELAADRYEAILARGHVNGHIFFNLGNCYFRLNQLGRAIYGELKT